MFVEANENELTNQSLLHTVKVALTLGQMGTRLLKQDGYIGNEEHKPTTRRPRGTIGQIVQTT